MYIRFCSLLSVAALAAVAAASGSTSQCNTGPIQCCQSTYEVSQYIEVFGYLGIPISDLSGLVALGCNPVTTSGTATGAVCAEQPVCCNGNAYNGLVNVGCTPITINA